MLGLGSAGKVKKSQSNSDLKPQGFISSSHANQNKNRKFQRQGDKAGSSVSLHRLPELPQGPRRPPGGRKNSGERERVHFIPFPRSFRTTLTGLTEPKLESLMCVMMLQSKRNPHGGKRMDVQGGGISPHWRRPQPARFFPLFRRSFWWLPGPGFTPGCCSWIHRLPSRLLPPPPPGPCPAAFPQQPGLSAALSVLFTFPGSILSAPFPDLPSPHSPIQFYLWIYNLPFTLLDGNGLTFPEVMTKLWILVYLLSD